MTLPSGPLLPLLSVVVPCRNGAAFIATCLSSLLANDWPSERLEVLVVDGRSTDGTREIVRQHVERYPFVRLLDNPDRDRSHALNIGIRESSGELVASIDVHTQCEPDYLRKCYETLRETAADNVGGIVRTLPRGDSPIARAVAFALSHPFGAGNSYFRIGAAGRRSVDTVPFGFYRRDVFQRIGPFNERLVRGQDLELNLRLRRAGGRIVLDPAIRTDYFPRSDLVSFARHNFADGLWVTHAMRFAHAPVSWRHLVPLAFVLGLSVPIVLSLVWPPTVALSTLALGLYTIVALTVAARAGIERRDPALALSLPLVFATRHVMYGLGSVWGLVRLVARR